MESAPDLLSSPAEKSVFLRGMAPNPPSEKRTLAAGRHLNFVVRAGWEFVERRNASGIVVVVGTTKSGCLVLVTQWRKPVQA